MDGRAFHTTSWQELEASMRAWDAWSRLVNMTETSFKDAQVCAKGVLYQQMLNGNCPDAWKKRDVEMLWVALLTGPRKLNVQRQRQLVCSLETRCDLAKLPAVCAPSDRGLPILRQQCLQLWLGRYVTNHDYQQAASANVWPGHRVRTTYGFFSVATWTCTCRSVSNVGR